MLANLAKYNFILLKVFFFSLFLSVSYATDLQTQLKNNNVQIFTDSRTFQARFISHRQGNPIATLDSIAKVYSPATISADIAARKYLGKYGSLFGIADSTNDLIISKKADDRGGRSMVRYQQLHNNVPVMGGEIIVNLDNRKQLTSINGRISPYSKLTVIPSISSEKARKTAQQAVLKWHGPVTLSQLTTSVPELSIYDPGLLADNRSSPLSHLTSSPSLPLPLV